MLSETKHLYIRFFAALRMTKVNDLRLLTDDLRLFNCKLVNCKLFSYLCTVKLKNT